MVITSPRPDDDKLSRYYQSDDYISHSGQSNNIVNRIYLQARKYSLRWKLRLANSLKTSKTICDIGCGTGEFLRTMKQAGWAVSGVEPNPSARQKAEQNISQPVYESLQQATNQFDLISLWHVLEHLPELNESLTKIIQLLKPEGRLLIAVPNHSSPDANHYQEYWAGYDVPRHLWHFNQKAMVLFLQKHGFTLEKTIPMKLDAFYVSMLSEKYMGNPGISGLIKGFLNGFSSNQTAKKTGEYSSLIYIARR